MQRVQHHHVIGAQEVRQIFHPGMLKRGFPLARHDQQPRVISRGNRVIGNQRFIERKVELGKSHSKYPRRQRLACLS